MTKDELKLENELLRNLLSQLQDVINAGMNGIECDDAEDLDEDEDD